MGGHDLTPVTAQGTYTVRKGDTLSTIALATGTTVAELVKCNNIKDPNILNIGQQLVLHYHSSFNAPGMPADWSDPDEYEEHRVDGMNAYNAQQRFDEVQKIGAQKYNEEHKLKLKG